MIPNGIIAGNQKKKVEIRFQIIYTYADFLLKKERGKVL